MVKVKPVDPQCEGTGLLILSVNPQTEELSWRDEEELVKRTYLTFIDFSTRIIKMHQDIRSVKFYLTEIPNKTLSKRPLKSGAIVSSASIASTANSYKTSTI